MQSKRLIWMVLIILALTILAYLVYYYVNKAQETQENLAEGTGQTGEASEGFENKEYIIFSNYRDPLYYFRFDPAKNIVERVGRAGNDVEGKIKFNQVEDVDTNESYQNVIIKGTRGEEIYPQYYFCNFTNESCQKSNLDIINLKISPLSEFALAQIFEEDKSFFAILDLKDGTNRKIREIESFEFNFDYLSPNIAIIQALATSPDNGNPILKMDLSTGELQTLVEEVDNFILSPTNDYLIYEKHNENNLYLIDLNNKQSRQLNVSNFHAVIFGKNGKNIYLAKEKEEKIDFSEITIDSPEKEQLLQTIAFSTNDLITDLIWLRDNTFLVLTKNGYQKEITLK